MMSRMVKASRLGMASLLALALVSALTRRLPQLTKRTARTQARRLQQKINALEQEEITTGFKQNRRWKGSLKRRLNSSIKPERSVEAANRQRKFPGQGVESG